MALDVKLRVLTYPCGAGIYLVVIAERSNMPAKAPKQRPHREDGSKCWCRAEDVGLILGRRTWLHHDQGGDFILSQKVDAMTLEEAKEAFGETLGKLRLAANVTQNELGARLGVNAHHIYLMEAGRVAPSLGMMQAIAEAFDRTETELLRGIRFPKRGG